MSFSVLDIHCLPLSSSYKNTHRHWTHINVYRVACGGVSNMLLVLSITFYFHYNIWGSMCSTGPFQHRSCYYHHQIGSIHLSHCYHIFFLAVCLRWLLHHILSLIAYTFRENWKFVFIIIVQFMMSANSRIRFADRSYSFVCTVHHLIIIIVQTYLKTLNL